MPGRGAYTILQCFSYSLFSAAFHYLIQLFTKQFFVTKICQLLLQAGIPTADFSGHSIRKGVAVTATAKGISRETFSSLVNGKVMSLISISTRFMNLNNDSKITSTQFPIIQLAAVPNDLIILLLSLWRLLISANLIIFSS